MRMLVITILSVHSLVVRRLISLRDSSDGYLDSTVVVVDALSSILGDRSTHPSERAHLSIVIDP